ncbi:MAG: class I SAM-dependent methyltransferase [Aeromicrobium sp.]
MEPTNNERTVESYELIAEDYASKTEDGHVLTAGLTQLANAVPGGHVLEIGSGPGWDADTLEAAGLTVRRTDITQAFINLQRARGKTVDRLDAISDELGGPYDAVVSLHVLQHVEPDNFTLVLSKIATSLRPGGRFLVSIPVGEGITWEEGESGNKYFRVLRTEDELIADLAAVGLSMEWIERSAHEDGWVCILTQRSDVQ